MITRFECPSLLAMLVVLLLHVRVKRDVRRLAQGFLGIVLLREWRHRTILSISLWQDIGSVYSMGSVPRHVAASRLPGRLGIHTTCGVFCYAGDWRQVMFRTGTDAGSPLAPWHPTRRTHVPVAVPEPHRPDQPVPRTAAHPAPDRASFPGVRHDMKETP